MGRDIPGGSESIRNMLGTVGVDTESFRQGTRISSSLVVLLRKSLKVLFRPV